MDSLLESIITSSYSILFPRRPLLRLFPRVPEKCYLAFPMATETVQHLIHDELPDSAVPQNESVDTGNNSNDKQSRNLTSVRPIRQQSTNPFLITPDTSEDKDLGPSSRKWQIGDFQLVRTLGTGKHALIQTFC